MKLGQIAKMLLLAIVVVLTTSACVSLVYQKVHINGDQKTWEVGFLGIANDGDGPGGLLPLLRNSTPKTPEK
jgi:hypothetical protein